MSCYGKPVVGTNEIKGYAISLSTLLFFPVTDWIVRPNRKVDQDLSSYQNHHDDILIKQKMANEYTVEGAKMVANRQGVDWIGRGGGLVDVIILNLIQD